MRRVFGAAIVAAFALAIGSASGRDDTKAPPEGAYLIVGLELGGKAVAADILAKAPEAERTLKIEGGKLIAMKGTMADPATFTVDTTKTPYQIDMTAKTGDKTETMYGIYKMDGDKLIICLTPSDKKDDRPKEFKTALDSKTRMMTLKKK